MNCIFTHGLNKKSLFVAIAAVFVFVFATDFILHGMLLKEAYNATSSAWRTEADMQGYMGWMMLGQFLVAAFLTIIFARGSEGKGITEGFRFGVLIGPFAIAHAFIQYSVTPIPLSLLCAWVIGGLIQAMGSSLIAAAIYKK